MTDGWGISCKIALRWMPLDLTNEKSTLVQVMAWCRQATSHYLKQCWPTSISPYGVTRPQRFLNKVFFYLSGALLLKVWLTLKHRETHGCVVSSTLATDALVLKHQTISILSTDQTFNLLDQFHMKILDFCRTTFGNKITHWKKMIQSFKG